MESGISFGELEQAEPEKGLRPDQDKHFAVAECGEVRSNDLPIFVDLDVLRDMEAHARTNTRVELGGVMLGKQLIDDKGDPFVVITDSLRANHYEATKGSFKFTHETWNAITRERNEFRPDLEMVGWYHTHPGWGVFLSGMDLFICNNFFNRQLDVALVVEPVANERGWFQWDDGPEKKTRETAGFLLMTSRYRKSELNYFTNLYNNDSQVGSDPRYSQPAFSQSAMGEPEEMVHIHDSRRPIFDVAIMAMLFMQFLLTALIAWRMVAPEVFADTKKDDATVAEKIRLKTYEEVLGAMVAKETNQSGALQKFAELAETNEKLNHDLEGQLARAILATKERDNLSGKLNKAAKKSKELSSEMAKANDQLKAAASEVESLKKELDYDPDNPGFFQKWKTVLMSFGGIALALAGILAGFVLGNRRNDQEYGYDDEDNYDSRGDLSTHSNERQVERVEDDDVDVKISDSPEEPS